MSLNSEQVSNILCAWDVMDIVDAFVDTVTNKVSTYVDVLHLQMGMWIVCAGDSAFVVTKENGGRILWETNFAKEGPQPNDFMGAVGATEILSFT